MTESNNGDSSIFLPFREQLSRRKFTDSSHVQDVKESSTHAALRGSPCMHIQTIPEGFNSGRRYYIQVDSAEECSAMVEYLQGLVKTATSRMENLSRFRKSQKLVREVYQSVPFQLMSSLFIILVN